LRLARQKAKYREHLDRQIEEKNNMIQDGLIGDPTGKDDMILNKGLIRVMNSPKIDLLHHGKTGSEAGMDTPIKS